MMGKFNPNFKIEKKTSKQMAYLFLNLSKKK